MFILDVYLDLRQPDWIPDWIVVSYFFLCPIAAVIALVLGILALKLLASKEDAPTASGYSLFLPILATVGIVLGIFMVGFLCVILAVFLCFPRI